MYLLLLSLIGVILIQSYVGISVFKTLHRAMERERAKYAQREAELLDRLMHVTGHTWTPPPRVVDEVEPEEDEELQQHREGWVQV